MNIHHWCKWTWQHRNFVSVTFLSFDKTALAIGGQQESRKRRKTCTSRVIDLTEDTKPIVSINTIAGKFIAAFMFIWLSRCRQLFYGLTVWIVCSCFRLEACNCMAAQLLERQQTHQRLWVQQRTNSGQSAKDNSKKGTEFLIQLSMYWICDDWFTRFFSIFLLFQMWHQKRNQMPSNGVE